MPNIAEDTTELPLMGPTKLYGRGIPGRIFVTLRTISQRRVSTSKVVKNAL